MSWSKVFEPRSFRARFAGFWSDFLHENYRNPEEVSVAFGVRYQTALNWWQGGHPQGVALPALVLNVISDRDNSLHMQGTGGLWQGRVQIDCYGAKYAAALALAKAVIGLLHGYRAGDFRLIQLDTRRDHHETGAADRPYRIGLDCIINYRRA